MKSPDILTNLPKIVAAVRTLHQPAEQALRGKQFFFSQAALVEDTPEDQNPVSATPTVTYERVRFGIPDLVRFGRSSREPFLFIGSEEELGDSQVTELSIRATALLDVSEDLSNKPKDQVPRRDRRAIARETRFLANDVVFRAPQRSTPSAEQQQALETLVPVVPFLARSAAWKRL
jgi:hypothetical protein